MVVERTKMRDEAVAAAAEEVKQGAGAVTVVRDVREFATTSAPQGMLARCTPIRAVPLGDVVAATDPPAVLVLDHLEDARNVGAIVRSAVAAGVTSMVVPVDRTAPLGAAAFKAAAGAFELMHIAVESSVPQTLQRLRQAGCWIVALDGEGDRPVFGLDLLAEPVAVVVGAEGKGLSQLARERADVVAYIPISTDVESLNASAAATVALFELARQRSATA